MIRKSIFVLLILNFLAFTASADETIKGSKTFVSESFVGLPIFESIDYQVFIPTHDKTEVLPVLVALHGCQRLDDFLEMTQLKKHAKENKFIILFPEQKLVNNAPYRCWNWFVKNNLSSKSSGELSAIHDLTLETLKKYSGDKQQVYTMGISAGGAMANSLGFCFPETYAGTGSHSGVPYYISENPFSASDAIKNPNADEKVMAEKATQCKSSKKPSQLSRFFIVHGTADVTAKPILGDYQKSQDLSYVDYQDDEQFNQSPQWNQRKNSVPAIGDKLGYNSEYLEQGSFVLHYYQIEGMAHALSGSQSNNKFAEPRGPDMVVENLKFFGLIQ